MWCLKRGEREKRSEGVSEDVIVNNIRNPNSGIFTSIQIPVQWVQCVVIERGEGEWASDEKRGKNVFHVELW